MRATAAPLVVGRVALAVGVAVPLVVLLPSSLHAQAVRGRVVDAEAGSPAAGAIVSLLRDDGRRVAPALVGPDGVPGPGTELMLPAFGIGQVDLVGREP